MPSKELKQHEVVALATAKYSQHPCVSALLLTLREAQATVELKSPSAETYLSTMRKVIRRSGDAEGAIPLSNTELVKSVAEITTALSLYAQTVINLACVMQALGENFCY